MSTCRPHISDHRKLSITILFSFSRVTSLIVPDSSFRSFPLSLRVLLFTHSFSVFRDLVRPSVYVYDRMSDMTIRSRARLLVSQNTCLPIKPRKWFCVWYFITRFLILLRMSWGYLIRLRGRSSTFLNYHKLLEVKPTSFVPSSFPFPRFF